MCVCVCVWAGRGGGGCNETQGNRNFKSLSPEEEQMIQFENLKHSSENLLQIFTMTRKFLNNFTGLDEFKP